MALTIFWEELLGAGPNHWSVGEDPTQLISTARKVKEIHASGHELVYITQRFFGSVPMPMEVDRKKLGSKITSNQKLNQLGRVVWYGEMAKFICGNL